MAESATGERVLVIKHGALGDFILALAPFAAIRAHHRTARIVLLTTAPFVELARASPYFDEVWSDSRPSLWTPRSLLSLRRQLRSGGFKRVYDLQTSHRSSAYYRLFGRPKPEWSGIARGCSHPHRNPQRNSMHTVERQREQLADAGIAAETTPDLAWLDGDLSAFSLPARFALIVSGGAPHRPAKRWPAAAYAALIERLGRQGLGVVLIGTAADRDAIQAIRSAVPEVLDLSGRTGFGQIAALARRASAAVGNDTGPMHLITAVGCPSVVLFSRESDPKLSAPRGRSVKVIAVDDLADLAPDIVSDAVSPR